MITGHFNGYHPLWGCDTADNRGNIIERLMRNNNLNVLNNGNTTRISNLSSSATDLSIVLPSLQHQVDWEISESPLASDHCLITMRLYILGLKWKKKELEASIFVKQIGPQFSLTQFGTKILITFNI